MITGYKLDVWRPQIHIFPAKTPWYQVQLWAKNNTPKDAIFITPPQRWGFYMVEWRVGSERSTVVTLSELLEGAFEPNYISYWKPRFNSLAPGMINSFNGDFFTTLNKVDKSYASLSKEKIIKIANTYNASFIVTEKPQHFDFPLVFENKEFFVYVFKKQ